MFLKNSRYKRARLFQAAPNQPTPFSGIRPRQIGSAPGVVEHRVSAGDRLDLLARHYYNDDRMWWHILDANPQLLFGGDLMPVRAQVAAPDVSHEVTLSVVSAADSSLQSGRYIYRFTFFDERGNERQAAVDAPSPLISVTAADPHPAVRLTGLPVPAAAATFDADGRRIYRSHNGGPFLLLKTATDLSETDFTDKASPESIADQPQPFDAGRDQPQCDNWVGRVIYIPQAHG